MLEYKFSVLLVLIGFIFHVVEPCPAWFVKIALDRYLFTENIKYLSLIALAMVGIAMLQEVLIFSIDILQRREDRKLYTKYDNRHMNIFWKCLSLFDKSPTGDILSRITADAETLQAYFGFASLYIINNSLFIIGILIVLLRWSLELALFYIMVLPFIVLGISIYAFKSGLLLGKRGVLWEN